MENDLVLFLSRHRTPGLSTPGEFFGALCQETGVPPDRRYQAECERLLQLRGLLTSDGYVTVAVRGRDWPTKPVKTKFDENDRWKK